MINRPENLAEGAGADGLLLVICGGQGIFNLNTSYCTKRDPKRSRGGIRELKNGCEEKAINRNVGV